MTYEENSKEKCRKGRELDCCSGGDIKSLRDFEKSVGIKYIGGLS